jgi:hypothetical protein
MPRDRAGAFEHPRSGRRPIEHHSTLRSRQPEEADMRTMLTAVTLAVVSITWWPATAALAQPSRVASGSVTEMSGNSITIQVRGETMKFSVDSNTQVEARGASTKTRQLAASGKPGPSLAELLTIGQPVHVTYEPSATPRAAFIRAVPKVDNGGKVEESEMRSVGTVKSLGADTLTIVGASGGGASFTQTFVISPETKVVGKGVGTATAPKGGKAPFSELISAGDHVTVSYHKAGDALHASDIRLTVKGQK